MTTRIDDKLLDLMRKNIKVIKYNNKQYKVLGRGGEGNIYEFDKDSNLAIKVFRKESICYTDPELIDKEIYVVRFLKDMNQIKDHVVDIMDYESCVSGKGYYFMELYDGDLQTWVQEATKATKVTEFDKDSWISMIFQVVFAFMYINSVGVLHGDPKPKNIFYTTHNLKDPNSDGKRAYLIDGKSYEIPYTTRFVLGDFSKTRIAGVDPDIGEMQIAESGTPDLYYNLTHHTDLYELSRLMYRVLVNSLIKSYSQEKIKNLVDNFAQTDSEFRKRIQKADDDFTSMNINSSLKNRLLNRLYAYELIESEYIKIDKILELDSTLVLPSKEIFELLERVADPNETMETLFSEYMI